MSNMVFVRHWLFPPPEGCALCARPAAAGVRGGAEPVPLCAACREALDWICAPRCDQCGRQLDVPLAEGAREGVRCGDCVRRRPAHRLKNRAVVSYTPYARELMGLFKYRGRETLASAFGTLMADVVRREYRGEAIGAVTFVPLHAKREAERGFNQAERLARVIGRELRLPVHRLITRTRDTPKQSRQSRGARLAGMDGAFRLHSAARRNIPHRRTLLIVDDVYTTGATLRACADALKRGGFRRVVAVTFAR